MAKVNQTVKTMSVGRIYITASFNNTIVTVTDADGRVKFWGSTGLSGFKGARKSTPFAATTAIEGALKKARDAGLATVQVFIKGPGAGRDAVLGVVRALGLKVTSLADVSPMAHNGPRPEKRRKGK